MTKFLLVGKGSISKRHEYAIEKNGGEIIDVYDPILSKWKCLEDMLYCYREEADYVTICSPNHFHYDQIKLCLQYNKKIVVEKPAVLPWQTLENNNNINVVLQLRELDLPETADLVKVTMPRNEQYFKSWKGNPKYSGGVFHLLFIHYLDLAERLKAKFEGKIISEGKPEARIDDLDILKIDMNELYRKMYDDIINHDKGVKPQEIYYLNWILERCGFKFGIGSNIIGKSIEIDFSNGINI